TDALTCALGDCDRQVRKQAKQALEMCGYCVEKGCCKKDCQCDSCSGGHEGEAAPAGDAPAEEAAPAPETEAAPNAYFPSRLPQQHGVRSRLANLFGFINAR
ncbi:MAG: hypothetical protein ACKVT0_22875, partial [Planctomycetaceae bacterium]